MPPRPGRRVVYRRRVPENLLWWIVGAVALFAAIGVAAAMANRGAVDYDVLTQRLRRRRPPRDAFREGAAEPDEPAADIVDGEQ